MHKNMSTFDFGSFVMGVFIAAAVLPIPAEISAQGCMPLHFTTPSLGGEGIVFMRPHQWQVGLAVRRVATDKFFVGDTQTESAAPFGQPVNLRLHSADLSITYAMSEQTSLSIVAPFSYSTAEFTHADLQRHQVSNGGFGDISVTANRWLATPSRHPTGNISLGLGLKAPTGSYKATDAYYDAAGTVTQPMITPALQLGDGGWAILAQTQAFQQVSARTALYASGDYSAGLKEHTDAVWGGTFVSVPDVYTARAGLGYAVAPDQGLSVSLGARVDGTRASDLFGGSDDYDRHAGYYAYVEPGLAWVTGPTQFTLSVPVRVRANYYTRRLSDGTERVGAGGVNDFIIYAGVSRRF